MPANCGSGEQVGRRPHHRAARRREAYLAFGRTRGKADEGKADEGKKDEGKKDEGKKDEGKKDEGKADEKRTFQKLYGTTQGEFGIIRVNMKTMNKFIVFLALRL